MAFPATYKARALGLLDIASQIAPLWMDEREPVQVAEIHRPGLRAAEVAACASVPLDLPRACESVELGYVLRRAGASLAAAFVHLHPYHGLQERIGLVDGTREVHPRARAQVLQELHHLGVFVLPCSSRQSLGRREQPASSP